jgi:hypothetical protein
VTNYKAARSIARGKVTEVLLACARGTGEFERLVVVKRLLPELGGNTRLVSTFLKEARLAASLRHPNVIDICDVAQQRGEPPAIVMEYCSGEDLRQVIALAGPKARIPVPIACWIAARVADALDAAHRNEPRILHRDVAPQNIIVAYDGQIRVVDFGIARALSGAMRGKLCYLSPEQINGGEVDARSDLFSLGAVLHELLTSRQLFAGPSQDAILRNVMVRPIPPPSVYNAEVPPEVDEIVLELLERDHDRRTESAASARGRLDAITSQLKASDRDVARWMCSALERRGSVRLAAEQQVIAEARRGALPREDALPPFLDATSVPLEITVGDEEWVTRPTVVSARPSVAPRIVGEELAPSLRPGPRRSIILAVGLLVAAGVTLGLSLWRSRQPTSSAIAAVSTGKPVEPAAPDVRAPEQDDAIADPATGPAGLQIQTVPAGAQVTVDGTILTESSDEHGVDLSVQPDRDVTLEIAKPGYEPRRVVVRSPRSGSMPVHVALARSTGPAALSASRASPAASRRRSTRVTAIAVASWVPDAVLTVDGRVVEAGLPAHVDVAPGKHLVRLSAPGYESEERVVHVRAGDTRRLDWDLDRAAAPPPADSPAPARAAPAGAALVRSSPEGARVFVGGEYRGKTPLELRDLAVGVRLAVELRLDGHESWQGELVALDQKTVTLDRPLRPLATAAPVADPVPVKREPARVSDGDVARISGSLPSIKVKGVELKGDTPYKTLPITVALCIDAKGAVSSARILKVVPAPLRERLHGALMAWRYRPYVEAGEPRAACFETSVELTIVR